MAYFEIWENRQKLLEASRRDLLSKSRNGANYSVYNQHKGKNRYARRVYSKIYNSVKDYNALNMDKFFKKDILEFDIKIHGETNDYVVKMRFDHILKELSNELKLNNYKLEWKCVYRALIKIYNSNNVYIWCSCDDFKYRFNHWSHVGDYNSSNEPDPGPGKGIANPLNNKGAACKHCLLVLNTVSWVNSISRTITNYINYMKDHSKFLYDKIIAPVLYGNMWSKIKQKIYTTFSKKDLDSDEKTLDTTNKYGKEKTQFKSGNTQGVRFAKNDIKEKDNEKERV